MSEGFTIYTAPRRTKWQKFKFWFLRRRIYQWLMWKRYSTKVEITQLIELVRKHPDDK